MLSWLDNELLKGVERKKLKERKGSVFFVKNKNFVVAEISGEVFWVLFSIWKQFQETFSLNFGQTEQIIKLWLKERLGLEHLTTRSDNTLGRFNHHF